MKSKLNKAIYTAAAAFICIGLILCVIGENNGGSIFRALRSNEAYKTADTDRRENYNDYYNPYNRGGYGNSNSSDDQLREFFRQFGMSDDAIDMFINPYGSSGGGYGGSGSYPIQ